MLATVMDRAKKEDAASQLPSKTVAPVYFTASPAVRKKLNERQARFKAMQKADEIAELEGTDERVPTHEVLKLFVENAGTAPRPVPSGSRSSSSSARATTSASSSPTIAVLDKLENELQKVKEIKQVGGTGMIRIDGSTSRASARRSWIRFKTDDKCRIALLSLGRAARASICSTRGPSVCSRR